MKKAKKFTTGAIVLMILAVFVTGCRTRTSKKNTRPVTPAVTDTAPAVDATPAQPVDDRTEDFVNEREPVTTEDLPANIEELNRRAAERGWIRDAFFEYDASTLSPDAQDALATSAAWLKAHPEYNLLIEGHCDERGTEQYNLALGDRRANTAREYLVTLGVDSSRIRTVSYGEERPFETGSSEEAHRANRRAHLVLTGR